MNIAYRWPIIYWNTACLSVDASAINAQDFYNLIDDDILDIDETEGKRVQNKMDYAKLAAALDKFNKICDIKLPDINKSRLSFTPNADDNSILYGLKGISKITEPVINEIMMNRPFNSLEDFLNRTTTRIVTKDKVINLIKCGAFDSVEHKTRKEVLDKFIWMKCEPKKRLTMQNANMLIDLDLLPESLIDNVDAYKLTKELRKNRDSQKLWYCADRLNMPYNKINSWRDLFSRSKIQGQELIVDGEPRRVIDSKQWDIFYENMINPIRDYIKQHHDELLKQLNNKLFEAEFNKYCSGDEMQWELDSINFFFKDHPLNTAIPELGIDIDPIDTIIEGAQDGQFLIKGKIIPKMKLYTIAGTVIDRDTTKGLVTIQCPDGVVNLKVYKSLFALYNQSVIDIDENGNKQILEESFFEKGVHLLITGIQRGATFVPKVYKNTGRRSIMRIILDNNNHFVRYEEKADK